VTLPAWLDWPHVAIFGSGVATTIGVLIAIRNLTHWRRERQHDARSAAAARIAEALFKAGASLESLRFHAELTAGGFLAAIDGERLPDRVLVRTHRVIEDLRRHLDGSTAVADLTAARTDVALYLPSAGPLMRLAERSFALIHRDVDDLKNSLDGDPPGEEFHAALKRITEERARDLHDLSRQVAAELGPVARHEKRRGT
jgi:hypothetical protein